MKARILGAIALLGLVLGAGGLQDRLQQETVRTFSDGGALLEERTYRAGTADGVHRGWWEDGTPRFEYHYQSGALEGLARDWYASGALYHEAHYRNGREEGAQRMYEEDGDLRANYVVKNGRRFGLPGEKGCTPGGIT